MAANPKRDDEEQPPRAEQVVCRYFQSKEHVNVKRWRWRGIEFGFKLRICKVTWRVRAEAQSENQFVPSATQALPAKALRFAATNAELQTTQITPQDYDETTQTYSIAFCVTPPDPSTGPPRQ